MPELKPVPRIGLAAETQRCFSCADTESAMELSRMLMLAEIRRLESDLDRALSRLRGDSHLHDVSSTHGSPHRRDGGAKSLSDLRRSLAPQIPEIRRRSK